MLPTRGREQLPLQEAPVRATLRVRVEAIRAQTFEGPVLHSDVYEEGGNQSAGGLEKVEQV